MESHKFHVPNHQPDWESIQPDLTNHQFKILGPKSKNLEISLGKFEKSAKSALNQQKIGFSLILSNNDDKPAGIFLRFSPPLVT
jgi:hypothetical protein